jgi:hypothetical protein
VTREPDVGVRVAFSHVVVKIPSGEIVVTLFTEVLDKTGRVAGVGIRHAVTDLLPAVSSTLATAARSEQVVVQFVVASGFRTIEDSHRGAFQTDNNRLVLLVREDMTSQAILFPSEVFGIVVTASNLLPLSCSMLVCIRIVGHPCEAQDGLFIRRIRSSYFIVRPGGRW